MSVKSLIVSIVFLLNLVHIHVKKYSSHSFSKSNKLNFWYKHHELSITSGNRTIVDLAARGFAVLLCVHDSLSRCFVREGAESFPE